MPHTHLAVISLSGVGLADMLFHFCRAMLCISAACAVMRCLSVCHVRVYRVDHKKRPKFAAIEKTHAVSKRPWKSAASTSIDYNVAMTFILNNNNDDDDNNDNNNDD